MNGRETIRTWILLIMLVVFSTAEAQSQAYASTANNDELAEVTQQADDLKQAHEIVKTDNEVLKTSNKEVNELMEDVEQDIENIEKQLETAKEKEANSVKVQEKSNTSNLVPVGEWVNFTATFYNAGPASTGKKPGDKQYGLTASGRPVTPGVTVSVDPRIIPLGTWIEVQWPDGTIENRRADDTGNAVRGHKVDVFKPLSNSELNALGVQKIKVRTLNSSN